MAKRGYFFWKFYIVQRFTIAVHYWSIRFHTLCDVLWNLSTWDWRFWYHFVTKLLEYITCAKNYQNRASFDKVIAKNGAAFFTRVTMLERAMLNAILSVWPSVPHTRHPRLNVSKYWNICRTVRHSDVFSLFYVTFRSSDFRGQSRPNVLERYPSPVDSENLSNMQQLGNGAPQDII